MSIENYRLRQQRVMRGWSQKKVANQLHLLSDDDVRAGVNADMVSKWERGEKNPRPYYQEKLCLLYGMTADQLGFTESIVNTYFFTPPSEQNTPLSLLQGDGDDMKHLDATRRVLLQQLLNTTGAALLLPGFSLLNPDAWEQLSYASNKPNSIDQTTLNHFEKITEGCWHLTNGSEMAVIEQVLPTYLPKLVALSQKPTKHLSTISELTAHGYLLAGLVALDQLNLAAMEVYGQLAIKHSTQYSSLSRDYNLQAGALKQHATIQQIAKKPAQALQTYQKTLPFLDQVSPLLKSRVYQGLARTCAQCGHEQESKIYLAKAQETFPSDFENDPSFLYADSGLSVLLMYEGLTLLDLDQPDKAWNAFTQVIDGEKLTPKIPIGQLTHLEFINLLGTTAVALRDRERSQTYLEAAVGKARDIKSQWGHSEARDVYQQMRLVWPNDSQVKSLRQLFQSDV